MDFKAAISLAALILALAVLSFGREINPNDELRFGVDSNDDLARGKRSPQFVEINLGGGRYPGSRPGGGGRYPGGRPGGGDREYEREREREREYERERERQRERERERERDRYRPGGSNHHHRPNHGGRPHFR